LILIKIKGGDIASSSKAEIGKNSKDVGFPLPIEVFLSPSPEDS
jgi:hypothetical protein